MSDENRIKERKRRKAKHRKKNKLKELKSEEPNLIFWNR